MSMSWRDLFFVFARIGILSFGGPAAQIALMQRVLVEEKQWVAAKDYLAALSFCMLLPGPEAMQLATYCGWKLRGVAGGILAGLLFVLPGALVVLGLAALYVTLGQAPLVQAAFFGVQAAVVVIVVEALWKVSKRALGTAESYWIAALSFLAIYALGLPFPAIILLAGLWGAWRVSELNVQTIALPKPSGTVRTIVIWGGLWWGPLLALWVGGQDFLWEIALFFSQLAVVTFGGAYAVLAWMSQWAVDTKGWLDANQMLDALGLAETTPGPLILVTEFVAFVAGWGTGGWSMALAAGLVSLWATFLPCFLWIFVAAPYLEWITAQPRLKGALNAIIAAVVGVILNLSLWFGLHVLFEEVQQTPFGAVPDFGTFNASAALLIVIAAIWSFKLHRGMLETLCLSALIALGMVMVF